jgi:hypothetical protein
MFNKRIVTVAVVLSLLTVVSYTHFSDTSPVLKNHHQSKPSELTEADIDFIIATKKNMKVLNTSIKAEEPESSAQQL